MRFTKALWNLYVPTALLHWLVLGEYQEYLSVAWPPAHISRLDVDGTSGFDGQNYQLQSHYGSELSCLGKQPTEGVSRVLFPTEGAALQFNRSRHEAIKGHDPEDTSNYEWAAQAYFTDIRGLGMADRDVIVQPDDSWDWNGVGDADGSYCSPGLGPTLTVISSHKRNETRHPLVKLPMSRLEGLEATLAIEITGRQAQPSGTDPTLAKSKGIKLRQCTFIRFSSSDVVDGNAPCRFSRSRTSVRHTPAPPVHARAVRDPHTNIAILITLASVLGVVAIVSAIHCALRMMRRSKNTRVEEGVVYDGRLRRLEAAHARDSGCKTPPPPYGPPPYSASRS